MGMLKEFKEFAMKGNVVDLAVGVVIGGAFGAIVSAIVDHVLMPVVGMITGGINFDALSLKVGEAELKYGLAISATVKFIVIAFFLFLVIKALNKTKKAEPPAAPAPTPEDIVLLREIRDALKK
ncbi:MAG TPA: large-conductance mechanosensitive channel protein MscL [Lacibacter sp.]|nr:large-conductance mechanosensitive channel protein MscL [Lacibacter sp.]